MDRGIQRVSPCFIPSRRERLGSTGVASTGYTFLPLAPLARLHYSPMTARHSTSWRTALGLLLLHAAVSACSSDDSEGDKPEPGGTPVLDGNGDGNGAIFDGNDGAGPNAGDGF